MKNRKCTSPNITPPEKAFKYTKALLFQLVQVLALIIVCSGNDSDIKDLSRFSEISIVLFTKGILFYTFSFPDIFYSSPHVSLCCDFFFPCYSQRVKVLTRSAENPTIYNHYHHQLYPPLHLPSFIAEVVDRNMFPSQLTSGHF